MRRQIKTYGFIFYAVFFSVFMYMNAQAAEVSAFQGPGCMGTCTDCHTLKRKEANKLLKTKQFGATIKTIEMGPIKGLWKVELTRGDKRFIVYVDFAKKYLLENLRLTPLEKIGEAQEFKKVDTKKIPLENAIVIGDPGAKNKIIVFDDPECPYCKKLHKEIKKIVKERHDIVFYIKMYPLPIHPKAYDISKAIVCKKSAALLDDAFAGKKPEKATCDTSEIDDNIKLARKFEIRGTPAIILPDGRLVPGYVPAKVLLKLMDNPG